MPGPEAVVAIRVALAMIFALATAALATRKNRSGVGWGIAGLFFGPIPLIILAFLPFVCARCHRSLTKAQVRARLCANCHPATKPSGEFFRQMEGDQEIASGLDFLKQLDKS